jgi:HPt (histidine-containing phosphotransfer) domain-containing protein
VLRQIFGGNLAAERQAIALFWEHAGKDLADLSGAVAGRVAPELQRAAHRMKGASAALGANGVAVVCEALEAAGREQDWTPVAGLMAEFEREWQMLEAYCQP